MALSKEIEERFQKLESKVNKHKYHITLLCGGYLLKRDMVTNEIELINVDNDEYESLSMHCDDFHIIDLFCLETWDEIENGTINGDGTRKDDALEKQWLLLAIHPECKTAKAAWRKEHNEYEAYKNSGAKETTPVPYQGPIEDIDIKPMPNKSIKLDKPAPVEPKHTAEWQHDYKPNW